MKRIQCWIILLLGIAAASGAQAEKADASKPTNIEANQMAYDDVKQINTFTGDVDEFEAVEQLMLVFWQGCPICA